VGILVQRIVGTRYVHGKWDLKVAGHHLKPGKYLVTLRALDRHRNVLGYAGQAVVKISRAASAS
jgi:hypothetical protein